MEGRRIRQKGRKPKSLVFGKEECRVVPPRDITCSSCAGFARETTGEKIAGKEPLHKIILVGSLASTQQKLHLCNSFTMSGSSAGLSVGLAIPVPDALCSPQFVRSWAVNGGPRAAAVPGPDESLRRLPGAPDRTEHQTPTASQRQLRFFSSSVSARGATSNKRVRGRIHIRHRTTAGNVDITNLQLTYSLLLFWD